MKPHHRRRRRSWICPKDWNAEQLVVGDQTQWITIDHHTTNYRTSARNVKAFQDCLITGIQHLSVLAHHPPLPEVSPWLAIFFSLHRADLSSNHFLDLQFETPRRNTQESKFETSVPDYRRTVKKTNWSCTTSVEGRIVLDITIIEFPMIEYVSGLWTLVLLSITSIYSCDVHD